MTAEIATLGAALAEAEGRLTAAGVRTPRVDAEWLLAGILDVGRNALAVNAMRPLGEMTATRYADAVRRRAQREPLQRILGWEDFRGLRFRLTPDVLVPRPETELLVEWALGFLPEASASRRPRVIDVGTGSGCIAVTLALELTGSRVAATDRSRAALALARANARLLGAEVAFLAAHWAAPLRVEGFDLLVSNPPYLDPAGPVMPEVARWEPSPALWAGCGGLAAYRELLGSLAAARSGTPLLVEIGLGQAAPLAELAAGTGWRVAAVHRDLAGIERVVELRRV